jgi:serine/threonine protein kinase
VQYDETKCSDADEALQTGAAVVKLSELGMSRRMQGSSCSNRSLLTVYVAPEVAEGSRLHLAADVYSFGVIMWELMMGCLAECASVAFCYHVLCLILRVYPIKCTLTCLHDVA